VKFSHRDFRPPRRSKYVGRPSKRWPTLRILLLGLFGLAVYLKFDTVAKLPVWKTARHPGAWFSARIHPSVTLPPLSPVVLAWETDSNRVAAECPGAAPACLDSGFPLGSEPAGQVRAILAKAASRWQANAVGGFTATFTRVADPAAADSGWSLRRLEIRRTPRDLVLEKDATGGGNSFCAEGRCLDDLSPHTPLTAFIYARAWLLPAAPIDPGLPLPETPEAWFSAANGAGVLPILRGQVVSVPPQGDTAGWLELHHGRNLFSFYRGLARLGSSVRAGAMIEPGDTLGWMGGDSARLELRIESAGRPLDPLAFLGLPASREEMPHER
jgi:hypothetical protein